MFNWCARHPFLCMKNLKPELVCDKVYLWFKEIPHCVRFFKFLDSIGFPITNKDVVIHVHPIFVGMEDRLSQARHFDFVIRHSFDADLGTLG